MATDHEKLVVALEARVNQFEREMARASRTADNRARAIEGRFRQMNGRLAALGSTAFRPLMLAATATLAPILSVAGALNTARAAVTDFDRIGKDAKRSGLDSEFFQTLAYQADLGGAGIGQLNSALETFARNAGMAVEGKGRMVSGLKDLEPELLKSIQAARSQEERLRLVADALNRTEDPARRAAIATAAFGGAGAAMVEVLKGGSAEMDRTAARARELGIVIDRQLIARAEELNDQFATASRVIDVNFKQALINLAPVMVWTAEAAARLSGDIRSLVDAFIQLENRSTGSLETRMRELGMQRLDIERQIIQLRERMDAPTGNMRGWESVASDARIQQLENLKGKLGEVAAEEERILKILDSRAPGTPSLPPITPDTDTPPAQTRAGNADAIIREAEAVDRLIDSMAHELAMIGATELEKAKLNAVRQAGAAATPEQIRQIEALAEAIYEEAKAVDESKRAHDERAQAIESFFRMGADALTDMVMNSEKAEDALKRLIVQLAQAAAQAALFGSGPIVGQGFFQIEGDRA